MNTGDTNLKRSHRSGEAEIVACHRSCGSVFSSTSLQDADSATPADGAAIERRRQGSCCTRRARHRSGPRGQSEVVGSLWDSQSQDQDSQTGNSDYATKQSVRQMRGGLPVVDSVTVMLDTTSHNNPAKQSAAKLSGRIVPIRLQPTIKTSSETTRQAILSRVSK